MKTISRVPTLFCSLVLLTAGLLPVRSADVHPVSRLESGPRPPRCDIVPDQPVGDELREMLATALEKTAGKTHARPVGLSVAVLVPGHGCWTAQMGEDGHGGLVSAHTRFHAAQVGNLVTSALVAEAVVAGRLELAGPLGSYLDALPGQWRGIPLETLLNHTSGLGSYEDSPLYDGQQVYTTGQLLDLTPATLLFASGTGHRSSSTGYNLLGLVLEKTEGHSWEDQVSERFLEAIAGCRALTVADCEPQDMAVGHEAGVALPFQSDYKNARSCGGLVGSALDLARIYDSILNARLITPQSVEILCDGQVKLLDSGTSVRVGRGFNRVETSGGDHLLQRGHSPGFTTLAGVALKSGVTVVVMANESDFSPDDYYFGLDQAVAEFFQKAKITQVVSKADSPDDIPPYIYRQPSNETVTSGYEAWFTVGADHARHYRWQRQNSSGDWVDLNDDWVYHNTRSSTLHVMASLSMDGDRYRCIVSNDAGSEISRPATLTVTRWGHRGHGGGAISPLALGLLAAVVLLRTLTQRKRTA